MKEKTMIAPRVTKEELKEFHRICREYDTTGSRAVRLFVRKVIAGDLYPDFEKRYPVSIEMEVKPTLHGIIKGE